MKTLQKIFLIILLTSSVSFAAGLENFNNYPETGSSYVNGTFTGQDGSTWSYTQCRGDQEINAPSPCLGKDRSPQAEVRSGTLHDGCGTLEFDWKKAYSTDVKMDVKINDTIVATVQGGTGNDQHYGPINVNVAGDFTISFEQSYASDSGQVIIDNVQWTSYSGGGGGGPTNKPAIESIINDITPTNNQQVTVYLSVYDDVTDIDEVKVFYTINDWSSVSERAASHDSGKVYKVFMPTYTSGTTVKYSAYAVNSYTNTGYATATNSYTIRSSDIQGGSYTCRVMAANITSGNYQAYESPGIRIFQGLKPDVVAVQEFNYESGSLRDLVDEAFGEEFYYYCEGGGEQIPNGIISRWPIKSSGEWEDDEVSNRDFAWAIIDIPGDIDLHVVSVHLLTSGSGVRNSEATEIKNQINNHWSDNDYIFVGGDMNTDTRNESAIQTFGSSPIPLSDANWPKDQDGNDDTNASRSKPYDRVLPNTKLNNLQIATVIDGHSFSKGLVYDSRVTSPYQFLPSPIQSGDSGVSGMQHMAVVKDFLIPNGDGTTTNVPPVLQHINHQNVNIGDTVTFNVIASDIDGDLIEISCSDTSHFSPVSSASNVTGTYTWTTAPGDEGDHSVIFTATANSLEAKQMINISVVPEPYFLSFIVLLIINKRFHRK